MQIVRIEVTHRIRSKQIERGSESEGH